VSITIVPAVSGTPAPQAGLRRSLAASALAAWKITFSGSTSIVTLPSPPSVALGGISSTSSLVVELLDDTAGGAPIVFAYGAGSGTFVATSSTVSLQLGDTYDLEVVSGSSLGASPFPSPTPSPSPSPSPAATTAPGTIAVASSSYVNDKLQNLGPLTLPPTTGNARAYADFFQDGTFGLFINSLVYNPSDPSTYTDRGSLYFYHLVSGAWVDETSKLLSDTVGCLHPRKAIVADFNGDAKPDIFVACHGADAPPYPGEEPLLLLSQPNGTYSKTFLPFTGYFHGASAAVLNRRGYADIIVADPTIAQTPYFLINNGDGTFHSDFTRLPSNVVQKAIYSAEFIDPSASGKFDLFLAGAEPNSGGNPDPGLAVEYPTTILKNSGTNTFPGTNSLVIPADPAYGFVLDVLVGNGNLYVLRTIDIPGPTLYGGTEVQKVAYPSMTATSIYTHIGAYPSGSSWIDWLYWYNGSISSDNAMTPLSVSP
jgi:hypothetical protein